MPKKNTGAENFFSWPGGFWLFLGIFAFRFWPFLYPYTVSTSYNLKTFFPTELLNLRIPQGLAFTRLANTLFNKI